MPDAVIAAPYQLVPTCDGAMLVNANDVFMGQAYLRYGESFKTEVDLLLSMLQFPGMVIDVGANMGVHAIPMAKELARQGRRMLAFEPQPVIFQQLCANLALNGLMNVQAFPYACGSRTGSVSFAAPDYRLGGNFGCVSMSRQASTTETMTAPCHTLDEIVGETQVALIKIDVEGFELEVLRGARKTIKRSHPVMYVENDRVEKSRELIEWLREQNYRLYWHIAKLYNPSNFLGNAENIYGHTGSFNMLCLHRDCPLKIEGTTEITDASHHPLTALKPA
ncbi:MAG: FkbM family methyltransferase [Terracidiphilus sp.]|jgi:FkbM family methyltransferase